MQVYTNCSSCGFFNNKSCELNKLNSEGFKGLAVQRTVNSGALEHHIDGRFCQFHRVKKWKDEQIKNGLDPLQVVNEQTRIKYGLVTGIDKNSNPVKIFEQLDRICNSKYPPENIYFIKNTGTPEYSKEDLEERLEKYNIPFRIKIAYVSISTDKFVDELFLTQKLKNKFYVCLLKEDFDLDFLNGLDKTINHDMLQIMYAGNNDYYFIPTQLHELCKDGFKEFLEREGLDDSIFSYEEILAKGK